MAWLSGLAGKAENLLNKIDQNTAAVLNKDKNDQLAEVMWMTPKENIDKSHLVIHPETVAANTEILLKSNRNSFKSNLYQSTPVLTPKTREESGDLILHLAADKEDLQAERDFSDTSVVTSIDAILNINESASHNDQLNFEKIEQEYPNGPQEVVDSLSTELFGISRLNSSLRECEKIPRQQERIREEFNVTNGNLSRKDLQTDYQKEINMLEDKLESYEVEKTEYLKRISELESTIERNRNEVILTRSELEQHRARALKTLQEKEKLIVELRENANVGLYEATAMELEQLRQERKILREENQQICEQLRLVREKLVSADIELESMKQKSAEITKQAQESIAIERRRRIDAEEDAQVHRKEVRSLKEELTLQQNNMYSKLRKQESEITRLRTQLSAAITPNSEVESRLATLTQTLVLKQQALENLTTERNSLRLQLEKIEHEYKNSKRNLLCGSVNDTDDVKSLVPQFLMETPFDTGVTRRVKRAYSSLDAISIRTGVFLRRYPLVRILVLIYMGLLHFWVLIVLFSESPEAH